MNFFFTEICPVTAELLSVLWLVPFLYGVSFHSAPGPPHEGPGLSGIVRYVFIPVLSPPLLLTCEPVVSVRGGGMGGGLEE
jgi:hypothetical protein